MKLRDLLKIKGRQLITVEPNDSVATAIQKLNEYDRGSITVCNKKGELVGIITERDIVRKCFLRGNDVASIKIDEVMTKEVIIGSAEDDLAYALNVMKQKKIRHLPIIDNDKLLGMVSMRDLLDVQLSESETNIRYISLLPRRPQRPLL
jgi:CBS domain-containing protein